MQRRRARAMMRGVIVVHVRLTRRGGSCGHRRSRRGRSGRRGSRSSGGGRCSGSTRGPLGSPGSGAHDGKRGRRRWSTAPHKAADERELERALRTDARRRSSFIHPSCPPSCPLLLPPLPFALLPLLYCCCCCWHCLSQESAPCCALCNQNQPNRTQAGHKTRTGTGEEQRNRRKTAAIERGV
jgi:hypothetical protein